MLFTAGQWEINLWICRATFSGMLLKRRSGSRNDCGNWCD